MHKKTCLSRINGKNDGFISDKRKKSAGICAFFRKSEWVKVEEAGETSSIFNLSSDELVLNNMRQHKKMA